MDTVLLFHTSRRQAWRKEQDGAFRFARTRGWRIQVVEPAHGRPRVRELIDLWKPIGCLVECSGERSDFFDPADFARIALEADAVDLVLDRAARGAEEVHLREAEFRSILHLHGLDCAVFGRKESFRSEKARGKACAAFLKGLPKPCGVMAENDYQAVYVLDLARRMRIAVPSQMAVIGVDDDTSLCENAHPALSSVYLDFEQAGYRTCEILSLLVADPSSGPIRETYGALGLMRRGSTPTGSGTPPRVAKMLAYVRERACEGISAADVAAQIPGSRRLAEMDFLRATGSTIKDEINRVRFEREELLLRVPSQRLGAIAHICGWQTDNALRAAFLKRYGMSMRAWRNSHPTTRPGSQERKKGMNLHEDESAQPQNKKGTEKWQVHSTTSSWLT